MSDQEYSLPTLAWGVGIAIAIVFAVLIIANFGDIINILMTEGVNY